MKPSAQRVNKANTQTKKSFDNSWIISSVLVVFSKQVNRSQPRQYLFTTITLQTSTLKVNSNKYSSIINLVQHINRLNKTIGG